jgi:hypothetical protein
MGASVSGLFKRALGDVVLAATRKFPNTLHNTSRTIEGAAMRCAYVALCYASVATIRWDAEGECVTIDRDSPPDDAELKRLAWRVCHERLHYVDLWHVLVVVGEKLRAVHVDSVRAQRRTRRIRRKLMEADLGFHDGHFVPQEGETLGTKWHDVVMWVGDRLPIQSHESLVRVLTSAARLCCEEVLVRWKEVFDTNPDHDSEYPLSEQVSHDDRVELLGLLLPHLAAQVRSVGTTVAADRVLREIEKLVDRLLRRENKALKEAEKQRPLTEPGPSAARYMMSVASIQIGDDLPSPEAIMFGGGGGGTDEAVEGEKATHVGNASTLVVTPFVSTLDPEIDVARDHMREMLATAFATGPYEKRSVTYVRGRLAARAIAEDIVTACYNMYTPTVKVAD